MSAASKITTDILHEIARRIPIFEHVSPLLRSSDIWHDPLWIKHKPSNLLPCILVCRLWKTIFTPYLYQYYIDNHLDVPLKKDKLFLAFRKHSHLIRWYLSHIPFSEDFQQRLPFDPKDPPKNISGLLLFETRPVICQLLVENQGARLKQLAWCSARLLFRDAFLNLPCLEELDLRVALMDDETLFKILSGCAETLRSLRLQTSAGMSSKFFDFDGPVTSTSKRINHGSGMTGKPKWMLSRLKALQLFLPLERPDVVFRFPQLCPTLETIHIVARSSFASFTELTATLQAHCPHIHTIVYGDYHEDSLYYPDSKDFIPLITHSVKPQSLRRISFGIPKGLDGYIMGGLIQHATTLVELELWSRPEASYVILKLDKMAVLLSHCTKLKVLRIPRLRADHITMDDLLAVPWACQELQALLIDDYSAAKPAAGVWFEGQKSRRRSGDSQRPIHKEYLDVGQGWLMKPGMKQEYYQQALDDSEWKCKLFEHMYTTSGVKNVKCVTLNSVQFFSSLWEDSHLW
ncbi:hypothetical protein BGX34_003966 [Mortierella sp. NVP85]|nr:hypothetical protein BGX34_003966 [Mortierella sp. NVP85]